MLFRSPDSNAMADFGNFILTEGLIDNGFTGPAFTWERNDLFKQRLDRVLFNTAWITLFASVKIHHGILKYSDHRPLFVDNCVNMEPRKCPFRFQNMWIKHPSFLDEVRKNWSMPARNSGLRKIKEKLHRLKQFLVWWNKKIFGNVFQKIKNLEDTIALTEVQMNTNPIDALADSLKRKNVELSVALDQEDRKSVV